MSPATTFENELCEVETARVIRPSAAFARRAAWLAVIRKSRESVQGVEQNTVPVGK